MNEFQKREYAKCIALVDDLLDTVSFAELIEHLLKLARYECASTRSYDELVKREQGDD